MFSFFIYVFLSNEITRHVLISHLPIQTYRNAEKSLARPSSRYRWTESIVSFEIHVILTETLGEPAPSYATVKNWVAQFKGGDFSTFFFAGRAKDLSAPRYFL
jgi:hypothetical protein